MTLYNDPIEVSHVLGTFEITGLGTCKVWEFGTGERDWAIEFPPHGPFAERFQPLHRGDWYRSLQEASDNLQRGSGDALRAAEETVKNASDDDRHWAQVARDNA